MQPTNNCKYFDYVYILLKFMLPLTMIKKMAFIFLTDLY